MNRNGVVPLIIPCVPVTAAIGLAQGLTTGSIGGSVTSAADGQALPGVSVTARSPALQGLRQTVPAIKRAIERVAKGAPTTYGHQAV